MIEINHYIDNNNLFIFANDNLINIIPNANIINIKSIIEQHVFLINNFII